MTAYLAVCFALVTIAVTQAQFGYAGRLGPSEVRGYPRMVGVLGEVGLPGPIGEKAAPPMEYCNVSSKIMSFIRRFRSTGLNGTTGGKGRTKRQTSATSWIHQPIICLHAGFNVQESIFDMRTNHCCDKCRRTKFGKCIQKFPGSERCHSEAIRCIASCINTNGGRPVPPGLTGGRPDLPAPEECPTTPKRVGDSYCIERSCIPV